MKKKHTFPSDECIQQSSYNFLRFSHRESTVLDWQTHYHALKYHDVTGHIRCFVLTSHPSISRWNPVAHLVVSYMAFVGQIVKSFSKFCFHKSIQKIFIVFPHQKYYTSMFVSYFSYKVFILFLYLIPPDTIPPCLFPCHSPVIFAAQRGHVARCLTSLGPGAGQQFAQPGEELPLPGPFLGAKRRWLNQWEFSKLWLIYG